MIEIYKNHIDQWEFEIKANNHRAIAKCVNDGYESKKSCLNAINTLLEVVGVEKVTRNLMVKGVKEIERRGKYV